MAHGNTLLQFVQRPPPPPPPHLPPAGLLQNACDFGETHFPTTKSAACTLEAAASHMAFLRLMSLEGSSSGAAANYANDRGMLNGHGIFSCHPTLLGLHNQQVELPSHAGCYADSDGDDCGAAAAGPAFELGRFLRGEGRPANLASDGPPACCSSTLADDPGGARFPAPENMAHASRISPCSMLAGDSAQPQSRTAAPFPCAAAQLDDQGSTMSCTSYSCGPNDRDSLVISTAPSFGSILGGCSAAPAAVLEADAHTSSCKPSVPAPKKKRKRARSGASRKRNREEVESQRMTHIAVERNRRRQMNEHLGVLRTLMPPSYIQRGDQASIIGGAIEFVKELEQILQSLQAQRQREAFDSLPLRSYFWDDTFMQQLKIHPSSQADESSYQPCITETYAESNSSVASVQVKMNGSSASVKVLAQRRPRQLLQTLSCIESLHLKIMHVNISTIEDTKLYSFNLQMDHYECESYSASELASTFQNLFTMSTNEAS